MVWSQYNILTGKWRGLWLLCELTVSFAVVPASAIAAETQTLPEYLAHVYAENPQLQAERAQLRAVDEKVPQALSNWRPTVAISAQKGYGHQAISGGTQFQNSLFNGQYPSDSYSVSITEPLFRGGRSLAQTNQAMNEIRAERSRLISVEQSVFLQAAVDYADVVRDQAVLDLQIKNEETLKTRLASERARLRGGEASRVDVAQAEASYEIAIAQRLGAEGDLQASRISFQRDIGLLPGKLSYPAEILRLPSTREDAIRAAETTNPDVRLALYRLRSSDDNVSVTSRQSWPTIDIEASYSHQDDASFKGSRTDVAAALVRLNWQLYQGGVVESQVREAEQTKSALTYALSLAQQRAIAKAETAWDKILACASAVSARKRAVTANETALTGINKQAAGGERTVLDILNAEFALLQARVDLLQVQHDKIVQEYSLAAATGALTARALNLEVKYYNPAENFDDVKWDWF